jgi:hypothetical protein
MREATMVFEAVDWTAQARKDIEVRRFRSQRHGRRGQCSFAIESGASQAGASQKVCDRFQSLAGIPSQKEVPEYIASQFPGKLTGSL